MFLLFMFFTIISGDFHFTTAQKDFWTYKCGPLNYTKNSTYKQELGDILYRFSERTNNGYGYFKSTFRRGVVVALCRGDMEPERCDKCVDDATRELRRVCPDQLEAVGWYDTCFLRYSGLNKSMDTTTFNFHEWGTKDTVAPSYRQLNVTHTQALLNKLRKEAAAGGPYRKYASGDLTEPELLYTLFGIMQCIPDLSAKECHDCLVEAEKSFISFSRIPEAKVYLTSCVLRYQYQKFFTSTWFPPRTSSRKSKSTNVGVIVGPIATMIVLVIVVFFLFRRYQKRKGRGPSFPESQVGFNDEPIMGSMHDEDNEEINSFSLWTIQVSTNNFSLENKLGEGGFGPVYRGVLEDGKEIAVKRLSMNSGQGFVEFKTEVQLIIKLQHKNLVRLLGYCVKGYERLLIYEYMENNSLDTILFDENRSKELEWSKRAHIAIGIAKGLRYLHEDSRLKIIHRDMKTSNVLLDKDMNSKISDFGTARIFGGNQMEAATNKIIGTYGYMAPEYAMEGLFSTKSDVYSFGVILLEIISGQRNNRFTYQDQPQNLLSTAWNLWKESKGEQLIDQRLVQDFPIDHVLRWINVALLCVQEDPQVRPTMSTTVFMLEDQSTSIPSPLEPLSIDRFASCSEQSVTIGAHPCIDLTDSTTTSTYIAS